MKSAAEGSLHAVDPSDFRWWNKLSERKKLGVFLGILVPVWFLGLAGLIWAIVSVCSTERAEARVEITAEQFSPMSLNDLHRKMNENAQAEF